MRGDDPEVAAKLRIEERELEGWWAELCTYPLLGPLFQRIWHRVFRACSSDGTRRPAIAPTQYHYGTVMTAE